MHLGWELKKVVLKILKFQDITKFLNFEKYYKKS